MVDPEYVHNVFSGIDEDLRKEIETVKQRPIMSLVLPESQESQIVIEALNPTETAIISLMVRYDSEADWDRYRALNDALERSFRYRCGRFSLDKLQPCREGIAYEQRPSFCQNLF